MSMSPIAVIGYSALIAAFLTTTATLIASTISALSGARRFRTAAEFGVFVTFALFTVASTAIIHAFIHQDFSLTYVYKYSDATMPWFYQLSAFWGGQAGSLMFWAGKLSMFSAAAVYVHRRQDVALMPWVITVLAAIQLFFGMLLIYVANPFETFSLVEPVDGKGLNPQLQTFTMLIHPPSLLTGYVSATIPFAFAMAALLSGRVDDQWLKSVRKWTLVSWLFLSVGLMLGMLWAYTELGWGGYWAWDPVENAAFIPWLIMTAFLHSAVIQERRAMLKRWNMILILGTWLTTILGTYITRSGLIVSVHSFAQSDIGPYFFWFLVAMTLACFAALAWRWDALRDERRIESPFSREAAFLANNWLLVGAGFVVLWGTLFPKLKEMFTGTPDIFGVPILDQSVVWLSLAGGLFSLVAAAISWNQTERLHRMTLGLGVALLGGVVFVNASLDSISSTGWILTGAFVSLALAILIVQKTRSLRWLLGLMGVALLVGSLYLGANKLFDGPPVTLREPWFNQWMVPIGIGLLALVSVGTMIAWRKASMNNFKRNFIGPLISATVLTVVLTSAYMFLRVRALDVKLGPLDITYGLLTLFSTNFVISTTVLEFWRGTKVRMNKTGVGFITAITGLVMRNQRRYGGYIVHVGMALLFFGFAGNVFRVDAQVTLFEGETVPLGDYTVTFEGIRQVTDSEKEQTYADVTLRRNDVVVSRLTPGRYKYHAQPGAPTTEVDLRSTPAEDVYFALSNARLGLSPKILKKQLNAGLITPEEAQVLAKDSASFMMIINPFVFWVWFGGIFLIIGTLLAMWPQDVLPNPTGTSRRRLSRTAAKLTILFVVIPGLSLSSFEAFASADHDHGDEAGAAASRVEVVDPVTRELYTLIRCECDGCAGQSLANCHLGCGEGLRDRKIIRDMLAAGQSTEAVVQYFVDQRGEGTLMKPPERGFNRLAWLFPLGAMVFAVPLIVRFVRRKDDDEAGHTDDVSSSDKVPSPSVEADQEVTFDDDDEARLERLEQELEDLE